MISLWFWFAWAAAIYARLDSLDWLETLGFSIDVAWPYIEDSPKPPRLSTEICHQVLMQVLPALVSRPIFMPPAPFRRVDRWRAVGRCAHCNAFVYENDAAYVGTPKQLYHAATCLPGRPLQLADGPPIRPSRKE
jgi:hypothetical protein